MRLTRIPWVDAADIGRGPSRNRVDDPAFGSLRGVAHRSGRSAWRLGPRSGSRARRA